MIDPLHLDTPLRLATINIGCGLRHKLPFIIRRSIDLSLDIIALQEIGDPDVLTSTLYAHSLILAVGSSQHHAGVGLLIARHLIPRCREYRRSSGGRLVGAILQLSHGRRLLVASAYMPSGLDHASPASPSHALARDVYAELMRWTLDVHQVVVMGDLNETLSRHDRFPLPSSSSLPWSSPSPRPIHWLQQSGFADEYRRHHPDASLSPGHTHVILSRLRSIVTSSRLDYIWTRGTGASRSVSIDRKVRITSHHHLLWMELLLPQPVSVDTPLVRLQLPNLRAASDRQRDAFVARLDRVIGRTIADLSDDARSDDARALDHVAFTITAITRDCAFATLPITGAASFNSRTAMQLEHQRRDLTRLLRMTERIVAEHGDPVRYLRWHNLYFRCVVAHRLHWSVDLFASVDIDRWIADTQRHIADTRTSIGVESKRMLTERKLPFDANPAAEIKRMLQSDALPSQLFSVVDSNGELTTGAADLENVMVDHFTSVFAVPPADASLLPFDPPPMLFEKPGMRAEWYDALMDDITPEHLLLAVSDAPLISAPGIDAVSTGVWRIALTGSAALRSLIAALFTSCLRTASFPSSWKSSIIIPFVKDALKERAMSNIRPISLQSCLGKLFNRILARRLAAIIARYPILNTAQRGFVMGGATIKCIDELLDAWDCSRACKGEQYTLFYDIKQAYDSVQSAVMLRALRRIGAPPRFVDLIGSSLTGLTSCIRTVYGPTRSFAVDRSLRQGDPLAPLLFVILMDGLHDGLDRHPVSLVEHGCRLASSTGTSYLPSVGYADDTAIIADSLPSLLVQNEWVHYFMQFNSLRLNPTKCELVGRRADGQAVTAADVSAAGVLIHGVAIVPRPHDESIRYLGVHACFDGSWATQRAKSRAMIILHTRLVAKFALSVRQAVYLFNVFLMPKLELALRYVHGKGTTQWVHSCDAMIIGAIKHAVSSPICLSHSAVSSALRLMLPSTIETSVKASELFYRMNSSDARWGGLGRMLMRDQCLPLVDAPAAGARPNTGSRLQRAAKLAVTSLQWDLHLDRPHRRRSRHQHILDAAATSSLPLTDVDRPLNMTRVELPPLSTPSRLVHNLWSGWGTGLARHTVDVYTDGSYDPVTSRSSWAVVVADQWFDDNHQSVPTDETMVKHAHVSNGVLIGSIIGCTVGVYPAELQAIARALAMVPASFDVNIHSDSASSIAAIAAYEQQLNERRRLRMPARPLLSLIHHLVDVRRRAGGTVSLSHVKAHTTSADRHSVGNRIADYQANVARKHPDRSYPLCLVELPMSALERHLSITRTIEREVDGHREVTALPMIDDPRRTAVSLLRASAMRDWSVKHAVDQGRLASVGMVDLGRVVMLHGSPLQQCSFVHVATSSIQYHWRGDDAARPSHRTTLRQVACGATCTTVLTLPHLAACPLHRPYREALRDAIVDCLRRHDCSRDWLRDNRSLTLHRLMTAMAPPPPGVDAGAIDEMYQHHARLMVGAFTSSECTAAAKRVGFVDAADGRQAMVDVRLVCLDHALAFYSKLKGIT